MGRKSRRNTENTAPVETLKAEVFPTAIYARLSDKNSGKDDDGAAIENQIEVCKEYIRETPDLQLIKVYMDNGWTGTNMRRPAFEEMMDAVRTGEIKAVVVRDLSRFARNYLETGMYLEKIFPRLDVRFISVKERFDTFQTDGSADSLMIPLQSLINDLYAKDISRKIHAAYKVQKEEKTFSWRNIPYGYMWNEDHTKIVPEEETAAIVRQIFEWRLEGIGVHRISVMLNERGIQSSFARKRGEDHIWIAATVRDLLKNPAYIGNKVWGRRRKELYKGVNIERTPETEWVVIENAHEPLVSKEIFEKVQELGRKGKSEYKAALDRNAEVRSICVDKLKGKMFCGNCGNRLYYKPRLVYDKGTPYCKGGEYYCRSDIKRQNCPFHCMSQAKMEKKILSAIRTQMEVALDYEKLLAKLRRSKAGKEKERQLRDRVNLLQGKIRSLQAKRQRLYEDYTEGLLDAGEYSFAKVAFDADYEKLNAVLEEAVMRHKEYTETVSSENKWIRLMKSIENTEELTQELVDIAIDKVLFYKGGDVEVVMKYQDVFELTETFLKDREGGNDE